MRIYPYIVIFFSLLLPFPVSAGEVNNSLYAVVLSRHVENGLVDYAGLKAHREPLDKYLAYMSELNPDKLSRHDQLAYYINLYNAATLRLIINHYPVDSIKDIGSFFSSPWKSREVLLKGKRVSLDHIEHEIIRPVFEDPRTHFALNCSALSCPPLVSEPYDGDRLEAQLTEATIRFVNEDKNTVIAGRVLFVSKIFDWYSEDFPDDVTNWLSRYARGDFRKRLKALTSDGSPFWVEYRKYDWSLNDQGH